jgi:hypothetical protein
MLHVLTERMYYLGCREAALISVEALKVELKQLNKCCDELQDTLRDIANPNKVTHSSQKMHACLGMLLASVVSKLHRSQFGGAKKRRMLF